MSNYQIEISMKSNSLARRNIVRRRTAHSSLWRSKSAKIESIFFIVSVVACLDENALETTNTQTQSSSPRCCCCCYGTESKFDWSILVCRFPACFVGIHWSHQQRRRNASPIELLEFIVATDPRMLYLYETESFRASTKGGAATPPIVIGCCLLVRQESFSI